MILRWLWLAFFLVTLWFIRRVLLSVRDEAGRAARRPPSAQPMVRDRVCNTFLPRSRALVERDEQGEHFFCSPACRDRFLAARRTGSP